MRITSDMNMQLLVCLLLAVSHLGSGELYTALADMEELFETEAVLMRTLEGYIAAQEDKLHLLRRHLSEYAREHEEALADVQGYLSNPINAYLLVKRLTSDWKAVESRMVDETGLEFVENITAFRGVLKFPSDEDLNGAAVALMRLQDTYKLSTSSVARGELNGIQYSTELSGECDTPPPPPPQDTYKLSTSSVARGELNGIQYSTELSAGDCYELGRQSYNNGDFYHTVQWMTEALSRHEEEQNRTTTKSDILEYLAFSTYMQGNVVTALKLTDELLELVPTHQRALGNKVHYLADIEKKSKTAAARRGEDGGDVDDDGVTVTEEKRVHYLADIEKKSKTAAARRGEDGGDVDDDGVTVTEEKRVPETTNNLPEREIYEMLCRGEIQVPINITSQLKCRYVSHGNPFLLLAPFKEEEAYLKPRIVLYHDVIYDSEMSTIKTLARPRFMRATVQNYKTGELETANYRISKSAWLKEEEHDHVRRVNQRAADIARLTARTAEELQVVNYGIGGHYEPHFDFARKEETSAFKSLGTGNRIATVLYYMSDVAQGGATVFPHLSVVLFPKKGTAAFWYNLHLDGEGDTLTRHAACPVLTGSKWVSNKWFHEAGQEFLRPCGLDQDSPPEE